MKLRFDIFDAVSEESVLSIEKGKLASTIECPCSEGRLFADLFDADNIRSEILFRINEARVMNEGGSRTPFPTSTSRSFQYDCTNCGRQLSGSVKFTLTDDFWKSIVKGWDESELSSLYLALIQISTKTKGGYVQHPNNVDDARDLLTVRCKCFTRNELPEPTKYFNQLCDAMRSNPAEFLGQTSPEPKNFTQKIKCKKCLQTISVETTVTVKMPTTPSDIIRLNNIWNPHITPAPFVFGDSKAGVWQPKGTGAT